MIFLVNGGTRAKKKLSVMLINNPRPRIKVLKSSDIKERERERERVK